MNKKAERRRQMIYEAELISASFEWAENQLRRLLFDLEEAQKNYDVVSEEKLDKKINLMVIRIRNEDKNLKKFLKKYEGLMNEKEKSLFNSR